MLVKLVGTAEQIKPLSAAIAVSLEELGLTGTVAVAETSDAAYAKSLGITKFPALAIEEDSLDFKDMIFEGTIPPQKELTAMFVSILGGEGGCSSGGCGSCSTGCGSDKGHDHGHGHASGSCGCH